MLKEFKEFITKGNMIDIAIGIVIGAAFTGLTSAFMKTMIDPLVGVLTGGADFSNRFIVLKAGSKAPAPYDTLKAATDAGANVLQYGAFISAIIQFIIVMAVMFATVKIYNRMKGQQAAASPPAPPTEVLLAEIRDLLKK